MHQLVLGIQQSVLCILTTWDSLDCFHLLQNEASLLRSESHVLAIFKMLTSNKFSSFRSTQNYVLPITMLPVWLCVYVYVYVCLCVCIFSHEFLVLFKTFVFRDFILRKLKLFLSTELSNTLYVLVPFFKNSSHLGIIHRVVPTCAPCCLRSSGLCFLCFSSFL